ncbi:MAG: glycogen/starch synthase, partial [Octadecabacter sp.]
FTTDGIEYFGKISFLKAGLALSQKITTVSPSYAAELLTPDFGMGLDGLLRERQMDLHGILNGIDLDVWDPETDASLIATYSATKLAGKAKNRAELEARFGLTKSDGPLFCVVSRLTSQKGLDMLLDCLPDLVAQGGRLALLGTGDPQLERAFVDASNRYRGSVGTIIGYDETLSHLIQAGSDAILIPSRFEPCGLTQLYGLRYGTLPVVARTGGLADTVIDANDAALLA